MKCLHITLFIFFSIAISVAQKPYDIPNLDSKKGVVTLKFSPDPNDKNVISSYNEGTTNRKPIKLKIKGTVLLQHVMVTVVSKDKNENLDVEIVKKDWEDIKKSGTTNDGVYQESFETAGKFGIKIHGNRPGIPFYLVVWTTGEMIPQGKKLFYPSENYQNGKKVQVVHTNDSNNNQSISNTAPDSNDTGNNSMMYLIALALVIIAILLAMMVFKKKSASIIILMILSQYNLNAGIHPSDKTGITEIAGELVQMIGIVRSAKDFNKADKDLGYLSDETDPGHRPDLDPAGQPQLPSSCYENIPDDEPRNGRDGVDGRDGNDGVDGHDGRDGVDGQDGRDGNDGVDGDDADDGSDGDDVQFDEPKDTQSDFDRPKYDKDGKPIFYDDFDHPKYDKDGKPIQYGDSDHPKYDKDGEPILYGDLDRPKYDKDGKPIRYGSENNETDYNRQGRPKYDKDGKTIFYGDYDHPKYDKDGKPIQYDDSERPKYDKDGKPINYQNNDRPKYDKDGKPIRYGYVEQEKPIILWASLAGNGHGNDSKQEGCDCLERAYETLHNKRYLLAKLKIIYNDTKALTDMAVAFGDNVSGLNAISGLAWQNERIGILKNMKKFYKAYDRKYKQLIGELEEVLKEIDKCENKLGFEAWYSKVGFIYYDFMKDKYRRN